MNSRQLLRRIFKSQWTQIFGPALVVLELIAAAASAVTGDWTLTWVVPILMAAFFIRALFFVVLVFFPVFVAVILVWAAYTLFKEKQKKKANLKATPINGTAAIRWGSIRTGSKPLSNTILQSSSIERSDRRGVGKPFLDGLFSCCEMEWH